MAELREMSVHDIIEEISTLSIDAAEYVMTQGEGGIAREQLYEKLMPIEIELSRRCSANEPVGEEKVRAALQLGLEKSADAFIESDSQPQDVVGFQVAELRAIGLNIGGGK